ncbi:hypothetical protein APX70_00709 [Pseudomonas syringae pv. maculicola]|uniref:Uncharacterized protein n=1 Tax=Pseudomonas syringae pv. maculicola TaxID=59511 RepID=A0A3M2Z2E5_PSEYM|nr:hypothetical protein APX70_00709 [Pseudomonas syringae pv. maculicola]
MQQVSQFRVGTGGLCKLLQVRRIKVSHRLLQLRQCTQGVAQTGKIPWPSVA